MIAHEMEGYGGQDDACVAWRNLETSKTKKSEVSLCAPMRFGTKRKTFSLYVWAVARSTATFASTTSTDAVLRRVSDIVQECSAFKR